MITFKQFINEGTNFDLDKFTQECDFFLSNIKGTNSLLWRGVTIPPRDYSILQFIGRTKTLDMPQNIHTFLNSYYKERIGYPIRNWMFGTGNRNEAKQYTGREPSLLFPIGNFSWFCFKDRELKDLWLYIDRIANRINKAIVDEKEATFQLYASLEDALDNAEYWFNEDLKACLESGNEVMINCKEYYLFNPYKSFDEYVSPYLLDNEIITSSRDLR